MNRFSGMYFVFVIAVSSCAAGTRDYSTTEMASSSGMGGGDSSSSYVGGHEGTAGAAGMGGAVVGAGGIGGSGGGDPPVCSTGTKECVGDTPRECDLAGHWIESMPCAGAKPVCFHGACTAETSCVFGRPGAAYDCGLSGNADCCGAGILDGGVFQRCNDPMAQATVSPFKLDVYEVTVGRFRTFVDFGYGTQVKAPKAGAGRHPVAAGSGWDEKWNAKLAATTDDLRMALACNPAYPTWTPGPGEYERMPMGCVTWYEAFAFCAWDGGRLPTEAEWNYAAAGGNEQKTYPWGAPISSDVAVYDCLGDMSAPQECSFSDLLPVGQKILGVGKYGQMDLSGGVWEWVLDTYAAFTTPCNDCALVGGPSGLNVSRGGAFNSSANDLSTTVRNPAAPTLRDAAIGFRCARD